MSRDFNGNPRLQEGGEMNEWTIEKVKEMFGFDPTMIGIRYRGFSVLTKDDPCSSYAKAGRLSVCARDGGGNEPDCSVGKYPNYIGTECDEGDETYRYYYFRPLEKGKWK